MLGEIGQAKRPPQNIVARLMHRQSTIMSPSQWYYHHHNFYNTIVPNYTENQVLIRDKCYPRKFSPDGKWLLAFSLDQHNVEVYRSVEFSDESYQILLVLDAHLDIHLYQFKRTAQHYH